MSEEASSTSEESSKNMWQRKRARLKLLPKTRSYPLNPARQYERDCETVLRAVGRYIHRCGFCPNTRAFARAHTWSEKATRQYLEDLHHEGYLEVSYDAVWNLTNKGWDFIRIEPITPLVPPEMSVKASSIREMKSVLRRLGSPDLIAEYDAFAKERNEGKTSPYDF